MHPLVLDTTRELLEGATSFQLHLTQVIAIGPDEPAQKIHRDQWAYDFFPFRKGYEVQCNTIWAMTDFTGRTAPRVIPGSNHFDDGLELDGAERPAEMEQGRCSSIPAASHGGGANRSAATRYGVNITYNRSWLRQEENQYLSVPLEVARTLPVELLRLIGYQRGAYALGYVDDLRDPIEVVRPDVKQSGFGGLDAALARSREEFGSNRA
jgi:ectoine hydroxylase-related dioxygenase (phytanoyl-CoA dioxygenase family)